MAWRWRGICGEAAELRSSNAEENAPSSDPLSVVFTCHRYEDTGRIQSRARPAEDEKYGDGARQFGGVRKDIAGRRTHRRDDAPSRAQPSRFGDETGLDAQSGGRAESRLPHLFR